MMTYIGTALLIAAGMGLIAYGYIRLFGGD